MRGWRLRTRAFSWELQAAVMARLGEETCFEREQAQVLRDLARH